MNVHGFPTELRIGELLWGWILSPFVTILYIMKSEMSIIDTVISASDGLGEGKVLINSADLGSGV